MKAKNLNMGRVLRLSLGFMLLYSMYETQQSLSTQIMKDAGFGQLGFYCLSALYSFYAVCCFFSTTIVQKLGTTKTLILGGCCYCTYCLSFTLPSEYHAAQERQESFFLSKDTVKVLMIISAMVNGFGCSITWVAQGEYLATCATDANKGLYNSIFWMIYMGSIVGGGLFASIIVDKVSMTTFYLIMTSLGIIAICLFASLTKPEPTSSDLDFQQPAKESLSIGQGVKATFNMLFSKRMLPCLVLIIQNSLQTAILAAFLVPLMTETMAFNPDFATMHYQSKLSICLLMYVFLGVGDIVGAQAIGWVQDRYSDHVCLMITLAVSTIGCLVVLSYIHVYVFTYTFAVLMCTLWGVQDAAVNVILNCILGFQFDDKSLPFSVNKCVYSLFIFVFSYSQSFIIGKDQQFKYMIFVTIFQFIAILVVDRKFEFRVRAPPANL